MWYVRSSKRWSAHTSTHKDSVASSVFLSITLRYGCASRRLLTTATTALEVAEKVLAAEKAVVATAETAIVNVSLKATSKSCTNTSLTSSSRWRITWILTTPSRLISLIRPTTSSLSSTPLQWILWSSRRIRKTTRQATRYTSISDRSQREAGRCRERAERTFMDYLPSPTGLPFSFIQHCLSGWTKVSSDLICISQLPPPPSFSYSSSFNHLIRSAAVRWGCMYDSKSTERIYLISRGGVSNSCWCCRLVFLPLDVRRRSLRSSKRSRIYCCCRVVS